MAGWLNQNSTIQQLNSFGNPLGMFERPSVKQIKLTLTLYPYTFSMYI